MFKITIKFLSMLFAFGLSLVFIAKSLAIYFFNGDFDPRYVASVTYMVGGIILLTDVIEWFHKSIMKDTKNEL